jgi:predicted alpha-1,2-mannosidase
MRPPALLAGLLAAAGLWGSAAATARAAVPSPPGPAALVDTRDGSLGGGFPEVAAGVPFGMISPGPDTAMPQGTQDPVDYVGYSYQDPSIRGFSLTHFDGAGIHIAGDLPFMPTTGSVSAADPLGNSSPYAHASELAQPGYYAVSLTRYGVRAEMTATARAAIMRFTFPATTRANVLAEVGQSIDGAQGGAAGVVGDDELQGFTRSAVGYTVYFDARFSRPFSGAGTLSPGRYVTFDTTSDHVITMRVGISYVSLAGAQANLQDEIPAGRGFDAVRAAAQRAWAGALSRASVTGGTRGERRTLYENLYRSLLLPSIFEDHDGRYLGFDGQVHTVAPGHHQYSDLSLWDIYRTQLPLLSLVEPGVAGDVMRSLIADAEQNHGVIPRWVQANVDRGIMAGDSGSAALADGAAEGLLTASQTREALALLVKQATTLPPVWPREHLDALLRYGYVPQDVDGIGPSITQEYGIDDNAVASLAAALGDSADGRALGARVDLWRNLVNPANDFIQPRRSDGAWDDPTTVGDPTGETGFSTGIALPYNPAFQDGYQEETGWQALWAEPQDPAALAAAIGGVPVALRRLDTFFSTALNLPAAPAVAKLQQEASFFGVFYIGDQYTSANEPDLWAPWFYDFYGEPWKAQKVARAEMAAYDQTPEGLPGNDDAGAISAWYVLAALGLYHAAPGVDAWELSSPAFPQIILHLAGSRRLEIDAPAASRTSFYVHALSLDGRPVTSTYLTSCQLLSGGRLSYTLGRLPDRRWGVGPGAAPPSAGTPSDPVQRCAERLTR